MKRALMVFLIGLSVAGPSLAQTPDRQIRNTVQNTVDIRQETQNQEDLWAREKEKLQARYRAARDRVEQLEKQKETLREKDASLQEQVAELSGRIAESGRLEAGLQAVLEETLGRFETFVQEDLPFLPEERALRLRTLRETLARSDETPAEKLRLLLEALQAETEYGDTVETYPQRIDVDGEPVFADIFRLGRVSIFWLTPDGERAGEYDRVRDRWVELPDRYRKNIRMAEEMAAKQRPVELIRLPLGRIHP
jgi:hypothetical protein